MGSGHHMGDSIGVAEVTKTSIGVASSERIAGVHNGSSSSLLSLPLAVVVTSTIQAIGGDGDGVLVDDWLASCVGDDSASSNGQRSLASVVDLAVEGGCREESRHLMDGSLQVTVVTGNGLVASDSDGDSSVGGNNVGLDGGGVGLVGDGLGGGDHGRGSVGKSVGVADNRGNNSGVGISRPLAVVSVPVGVAVAVSVAEMSVVSSVQQVGISISLGLGLGISGPLSVVVASIGVAVAIAIA